MPVRILVTDRRYSVHTNVYVDVEEALSPDSTYKCVTSCTYDVGGASYDNHPCGRCEQR